MKRAFILATGADTGGAAIRVVEAFSGSSEWSVRSMVASSNYIAYPQDIPHDRAELDLRYAAADVVVLHNTLHGHHWYDEGKGKPTVLMHHGLHDGHYAQSLSEVIAEGVEIGAVQIGSTVNLELFGPIEWVPIPYDLDALASMRRRLYRQKKVVRVAHCPTDRSVKSTDLFLAAIASLQAKGLPVEALLVEGATHDHTLNVKAKQADILVDQLRLGYGNNAIEAWAMGVPVIGGVNEYPAWREHMVERWGSLPFYEASETDLEDKLEQMILSPSLRREWGQIGLAHVRRFHGQSTIRERLSEIYRTTPSSKPSLRATTRPRQGNYRGRLRAARLRAT